MKRIDVGQAIGILANIGVLGGVIFLAVELRQNTQAVQLTSAEGFLSGSSALDLRIAQDPELASLLLRTQRAEPLTEVETLQLERWFYASLRQWETAQYLYSIGTLDESLWLAYRHEIARIMRRAELLTEYPSTRRPQLAESGRMMLGRSAPNRSLGRHICGWS